MTLIASAILLGALFAAITVHEFAHAWSATLLGDEFPRRQGRVSLNPFRHLSALGTLALFVVRFGWGRPVIVNPYHFRHPRRDYFLSSVAGPAANLLLAGLCLGGLSFTRRTFALGPGGVEPLMWAHFVLSALVILNVMLAALNLIPIPPLDGSKIWGLLIPGLRPVMNPKVMRFFILALVALVWTKGLRPLLDPVFAGVEAVIPTTDGSRYAHHLERAYAATDSRDWPAAEAHSAAALALNPGDPDRWYARACARGWRGNWAGALADVDEACRLSPNSDYHDYRAVVLEALGRADEAGAARAFASALRPLGAASGPPTTSRPHSPTTRDAGS